MRALLLPLFIINLIGLGIENELARAESDDVVFYQMYKFFDAAEDKHGLDQQVINSLRVDVGRIRKITTRFNVNQTQPDYIKALSFDGRILQSALVESDAAKANEKIKYVRDDLDLKLSYESSIAGAQDLFRGKVNILVYTKKDGADVNGLIVGANPRMWEDMAEVMFPIGPSSPAHGFLTPGIYRILVTKPGGQFVVAQDCSIGFSRKDSEDVTVVLPDGP